MTKVNIFTILAGLLIGISSVATDASAAEVTGTPLDLMVKVGDAKERLLLRAYRYPPIFLPYELYSDGSVAWDSAYVAEGNFFIQGAILNRLKDEHGGEVLFDEVSAEYEELCNSWGKLVVKGDDKFLLSRIQKELDGFDHVVREKLGHSGSCSTGCRISDDQKEIWSKYPDVVLAEKTIEANIVKYLRNQKADGDYKDKVCKTVSEIKDALRERDRVAAEKAAVDEAFAPDNQWGLKKWKTQPWMGC